MMAAVMGGPVKENATAAVTVMPIITPANLQHQQSHWKSVHNTSLTWHPFDHHCINNARLNTDMDIYYIIYIILFINSARLNTDMDPQAKF